MDDYYYEIKLVGFDNEYITKCKDEEELGNFLLNYDREDYSILEIKQKEKVDYANYLVFCSKKQGLETGK